jgi:tetratricopeptide (TPR) repeat protein
VDQIGKYRLQGELGRGGFGTVYRAWDPEMRRSVAIKVLNLHVGNDPATLARFRAEAATTANLHHRNIVTIYDSGEHGGQPWFAMEFLDGKTLRKALEETPALELWEKVNILLQIAEGLHYAHDRGVVHRDIKPANVMLLEGGAIKVLDFGIARLTDSELTQHVTTAGLVQGTFGYLAPEQLEGSRGDRASDIFSYGVVCYETLTGVQPFHANSLAHAVNLIANFDPAPVGRFLPGCPPPLEEIVHRALAKDLARRYRSLRELILDLAPIEVSLRTSRATELAGEAEALLGAGDPAGAQARLDRALALDRLNERGQALRRLLPAAEHVPDGSDSRTFRRPIEPAAPPAEASQTQRVVWIGAVAAIVLAAAGLFYFRAPSAPPVNSTVIAQPASKPVIPKPASPPPAPEPKVVAPPSAAEAIGNAIESRDWLDASTRLKQFEKLDPGDPRIKDWHNQIAKGSAHDHKVADLHLTIAEAIRSRNWNKADSQIRKLLKEAPLDAQALRARQEVVDGIKEDRDEGALQEQIKTLRASIKSDLKSKRWNDAVRDIAELLSLVPGDQEAIRWKNDLAKRRQ